MKLFIRGIGIFLAVFLFAALFSVSAGAEGEALPGALTAVPKTLWDEGEILEDGSICYTVAMVDGDTVAESYKVTVSPDGTIFAVNSACEEVGSGNAELREDGAILSMELVLKDGIQLNQLRQPGEGGEEIIMSQVIFADGTSAIISRSFDPASGEMTRSLYTEYGISGHPLFEIEEVAAGRENGKTVYTTTVSSYNYDEQAGDEAPQAIGESADAAPAAGGAPASEQAGIPEKGADNAGAAAPIQSIVASKGAAPAANTASPSGSVTKSSVSYTATSTSYTNWNDAVNQTNKIKNTVTNVIDGDTLIIREEKVYPDGKKVVIEDVVDHFSQENYQASVPRERRVTEYQGEEKVSESSYTWKSDNDENDPNKYHLETTDQNANLDEHGRNRIVVTDEKGETIQNGKNLGEVEQYYDVKTDENGNPVINNNQIESERYLTDGTNSLGGFDGPPISEANIPGNSSGASTNAPENTANTEPSRSTPAETVSNPDPAPNPDPPAADPVPAANPVPDPPPASEPEEGSGE